MNNKDYYLHRLSYYEEKEIISHGKVNGSIIHELLSSCEKHHHLEIREYLHTSNSLDYDWYDVEGIGYGWRWLRFEDEPNDDKLRESLIKDIKKFVYKIVNKEFENELYYIYSEYRGEYRFLFFNQTNDRMMYSFRFSEVEICC